MADARKLDQMVFDGYVEGLAEAGWHGDPRLVRLGYAASSALCFGIGYPGFVVERECISLGGTGIWTANP